jgi:HNH endonuclease/AP2 domain
VAPLPSIAVLHQRLAYDPETGVMTWRERADVHPGWNTRYAGKAAGTINDTGYIVMQFDGRRTRAHRIAWAMTTGAWPTAEIDHINGKRDDNRLSNLRLATPQQNKFNSAPSRLNTSGRKGVSFNKRMKKWVAYAREGNRHKHLGTFGTFEEAAAARNAFAQAHHGEFHRDA